jgi:hypothetical protein
MAGEQTPKADIDDILLASGKPMAVNRTSLIDYEVGASKNREGDLE